MIYLQLASNYVHTIIIIKIVKLLCKPTQEVPTVHVNDRERLMLH